MRLWILSDLHLELTRGWVLPCGADRPRFDVLVVAGDLVPKMERGVRLLLECVPDHDVIYVAGNHEFYGEDIDRTVEKAREAAAGTNVRILERDAIRIGDVTFAGATLWTDFNLFGDQRRAMRVAFEKMNDFRRIRASRYVDRFLPHHALERHLRAVSFFEAEFRKARPGPLVAISHHAPLSGWAVPPTLDAKPLSDEDILHAAYCSDLTRLMVPAPDDGRGPLRPADLWIYGHTHESVDMVVGSTRMVSNAKGYGPGPGPQRPIWDNQHFDQHYVIEI
jgi:predicted phosphodiesterase